ncbi:exodeoxyribonuclease V subunit alpha [Paraferrimonas haliotis]|uniref:RecBCD enzyme subunit RecD n=1 Tax=Paraferrimonas haliotis TaxID=2013866 RepID=A0AA37TMU9_9GAMM|nr:exodeoxyribonuclease V subunit alpha [Paraferrimonas haliotis]GLS84614.1 RecBCD enzyme subunit RecD [Paraferrimonas haliotis]
MITRDWITTAIAAGRIRAIDYQFAKYICADLADPVFWLALRMSQAQAQGHVCININQLVNEPFTPLLDSNATDQSLRFADQGTVVRQLLANRFVSEASSERNTPLVLDGDDNDPRLYLSRYWYYERNVALNLLDKASRNVATDIIGANRQLTRLFGTPTSNETDWQRVACALAISRGLAIITGGPGTGKTTTVIRLLALSLMQQSHQQPVVIRLAAPTGKAAVRMTESIRNAKAGLALDDELLQQIPESATTIHRLLGAIPNSVEFRHNRDNPLQLDFLVVDEASMIDLALMAKLLAALPAHCKLVLLGDKDQLSSVEAGAVMGDLCRFIRVSYDSTLMTYSPQHAQTLADISQQSLHKHQSSQANAISDCLCMLQKSWRFGGHIGDLAKAVNQQNVTEALQLIHKQHGQGQLNGYLSEPDSQRLIDNSLSFYEPLVLASHQASVKDANTLLTKFDGYRVLCATRGGELGTEALNERIEARLLNLPQTRLQQGFYPGRLIMITANDYSLGLYNGDIGITLEDEEGQLRVCFLQMDGSVRSFLPSRLSHYDVAFAMTIHKSQGSEFNHVAIALPPELKQQQVLSKELLYTGITRAKSQVSIYAQVPSLRLCIERATVRQSGLWQQLQALQQ